jgi:hypothetical protein
MAEAHQISDPTPAMSMQRYCISCGNAGMKNAYPLVFEQQLVMSRRSCERIERVGPRPLFRVRKDRILGHGYVFLSVQGQQVLRLAQD